jgi:hypothetical protein
VEPFEFETDAEPVSEVLSRSAGGDSAWQPTQLSPAANQKARTFMTHLLS